MKKSYANPFFKILSMITLLVFSQLKASAGGNISTTVTGSPFCQCAAIVVNYSVIGLPINAGNIYTVQLSDATGSFASPTVIGTLVSTALSGSISCTIPCAQAAGTGYRMRTLASNAAATGTDNGTNLTINAQVLPAATISVVPNDTLCASQTVTFTAGVANGGPTPVYQWYKNGFPVGGNSAIYTDGNPAQLDVYWLTMTSNAACAVPASVNSDTIHIVILNSTSLAGNIVFPENMTQSISAATDVRYFADCDLMATLTPAPPAALNGNTTVKVTIDNTVNSYNGQPYVQRHYDIEPANNAATATASIKLYAYQSEFDAYNIAATAASLPLLPTGAVDNGNVKITQFHGTGTAPGNYTGAELLISPTVSWDAVHSWWVMDFPVTGFSGFYIHTAWGHPLAVKLNDISARNEGASNIVGWSSSSEASGDSYVLEHSSNGENFGELVTIPAKGRASTYSYNDSKPYDGVNYYRVKLTDVTGNTSYTNVVTAIVKNSGSINVQAYPNPVKDVLQLNYSDMTSGEIELTDMAGKMLWKQTLSRTVNMKDFAPGTYLLRISDASTGAKLTKMISKE